MSKYVKYAQKLDTAFKTARERYMDSFNDVTAARKKVEDAKTETDKHYVGEADLLREEAATALHRAEIVFNNVQENVWGAFDTIRDELTEKLQAEVRADSIAAPEDIDANGLTLLQSGILRVDELENLLDRWGNNITMTRILGQYAKAAAEKTENAEERARLVNISRAADSGPGVVLQTWGGLLEAAKVCSGRSHGEERGDPRLVVSISKTWEQLTAATVESF